MPTTTPIIKKTAVIGYGATVTECEPTQASREKTVSLQMFSNFVITI